MFPVSRSACSTAAQILRRHQSIAGKDKRPTTYPIKKQQLKNQDISIRTLANEVKPKVSPDAVPEPTKQELRIVALHQAIPFVGFGFMDNSILLLSGEAIDMYLGVKLGISTMCAAALGNIISDLAGVALGTVIEDAVAKWSKKIERVTNGRIRLPPMPKLTYEQRNLRSVRYSTKWGARLV